MDIRKINDSISVSPQIRLEDAHELARLGFKSIISNRPDGEEDGQPSAESICMAAEGAGLEFRHIPVVASNITDRDVTLFADGMKDLPKPVVAFCRSGTRSCDTLGPVTSRRQRGIVLNGRGAVVACLQQGGRQPGEGPVIAALVGQSYRILSASVPAAWTG
jgi:sulfide:quinone oxidoreductase